MARQTRERILETSLAMFNAQGEPNVTTNHIADELGISPGNLYYHFRSKDDIVEHLFARYEARIGDALALPGDRAPDLEDIWLQLHLVFESLWDYRFLYRDLVDILARNRKLKLRFARIMNRAGASATDLLRGLVRAGVMRASADEIHALAENVLLVATFWMSFDAVRGGKPVVDVADLSRGIHRVMMLIAPFLRDAERYHLNTLAATYVR
ncbi:TetR/AcrR family transcriptional regulator [Dokdonella fugitiva]|jgi:AcrR family transcriptional regulator|uniref:TetR family transcriptional regulator n=1 Tax=Dokdonella fugitiva TaxID=328517 RepID=A0A4V2S2J8_9GAMM|nr:TetR/AcrR family transcriptional regulator [Dokdonella fugitiva]MBA8883393.1 AcrR family transcriptional regulator [Dokdonella fugitiva]TCO40710.1 TetR family transcriptional regulator [Dokdonella fugitiva]